METRSVKGEVFCRRFTHVQKVRALYWIKLTTNAREDYCAAHYHSRMNEVQNRSGRFTHGQLVIA